MYRHQYRGTEDIKKQGNMTPPKEYNNPLELDPEAKEIHEKYRYGVQNNDCKETQYDTREHRYTD